MWLPRTDFQGAAWVTSLHREWFAEYSASSFSFLEVAATAGAVKGFTEVIGFFRWKANNTGTCACVQGSAGTVVFSGKGYKPVWRGQHSCACPKAAAGMSAAAVGNHSDSITAAAA